MESSKAVMKVSGQAGEEARGARKRARQQRKLGPKQAQRECATNTSLGAEPGSGPPPPQLAIN